METERLQLRPWREEDAEGLYRLASDPEVGPRAGWSPHRNIGESLEVIRTLLNNDHTWAIRLGRRQPACENLERRQLACENLGRRQPACENPSSPIVGCICYYLPSESNIGIGPHDAEVGYWVGRPWWNQGIATEALRLIIDYCFIEKGFHTLWADHFPDNPASGRVLQKCGFRDTGRRNLISHLAIGADRPVKVMRLDRPTSNHME